MGAQQERFERQYLIFLAENYDKNPFNNSFNLENWKGLVLNDLNSIESSKIGTLLLRSISYWGNTLWIVPLLQKEEDNCNSVTEPPDILTGPSIHYSPMSLGKGSFCGNQDVWLYGYLNLSYEALFHEMVHALRWVSGKNNKGVTLGKGLSFYDNKEEFIAVLVQGIWASELKRPIRSSHYRHLEIDDELKGSYKFFASGTDTYRMVKEFCSENHGFTSAIACIDVPFNPIRAFYFKPAVVKNISLKSSLAKDRDKAKPLIKAAKDFIKAELSDLDTWMANLGKPPTGPSNKQFPLYK
jgi:hypothetical protein